MADLDVILPDFPTAKFAALLPALERHNITTTDLLTLDPADLGKRTQLPLLDLKRLCASVVAALHRDLAPPPPPLQLETHMSENDGSASSHPPVPGPGPGVPSLPGSPAPNEERRRRFRRPVADLETRWSTISTLDPTLDAALGGGIPTGYVTEVTGESGAGKTQLLLSLLLAVQLPPPHGLGRPALYISTESHLSTTRLSQMLRFNPLLSSPPPPAAAAASNEAGTGAGEVAGAAATETASVPTDSKPRIGNITRPSLDNILSIPTEDLEAQDHILTFQVPVAVRRRNVGLVVLDSVAANYRAEYERAGGRGGQASNLGARGGELVRLGAQLRELARDNDLAVVVANQVADRFNFAVPFPPSTVASRPAPPSTASKNPAAFPGQTQESPLASRSTAAAPSNAPPGPPLPADQPPSSSIPEDLLLSSIPEPAPAQDHYGGGGAGLAPQQHIPALLLDHQQRWFTGWGDDPLASRDLKNPSLGVVWSTQIACRLALIKRPAIGTAARRRPGEEGRDGAPRMWRRWMKVVFAPHVAPTGQGLRGAVEFDVTMGGLKTVVRGKKRRREEDDDDE